MLVEPNYSKDTKSKPPTKTVSQARTEEGGLKISKIPEFTPTEIKILFTIAQLIAQNEGSLKHLTRELKTSQYTIRQHLGNIYFKLGFSGSGAQVKLAVWVMKNVKNLQDQPGK